VRVAIHQPHYLPWLGLIDKIDQVDLFVWLDDTQFAQRGWQHRNYIKTANGPLLLTLPMVQRSPDERICDKAINTQHKWRHVHRKAIEQNYRNAPHWTNYGEAILGLYGQEWDRLVDVAIATAEQALTGFGVTTKTVRASELSGVDGLKSELVAAVCAAVGATTYLSGDGARAYLDEEALRRRGVTVEWQDFRHPEYTQLYPKAGFAPRMAAIDLLTNAGGEAGLALLRDARATT